MKKIELGNILHSTELTGHVIIQCDFGIHINNGIALLKVSFIAMKYLLICFERRQKRLNQTDFAIANQTNSSWRERNICSGIHTRYPCQPPLYQSYDPCHCPDVRSLVGCSGIGCGWSRDPTRHDFSYFKNPYE